MSSDYYAHIAGGIADEGRDDYDPDDYDERLMPPSRDEDDDHGDSDDDWEPDPASIPDIDRATATDEEKLAWVKARAAAEPWTSALPSVIQDMTLMGIPLNPDLMLLGMGEAIVGGEQGTRRFIDGLTLHSIARGNVDA